MRADQLTLPRVLTAARARELGLSRKAVEHALTRRGWQRLKAGVVLTTAATPTRSDWARVALLEAGPTAALTGWDAVRLHAPRLAPAHPPQPYVLVLTPGGRNRGFGRARIRATDRAFGSRMVFADSGEPAGYRIVTLARAIADCALEERSLANVRAMVTGSGQRGLCRPEELLAELATGPRNGSALLRRAVSDLVDGARSVAEAEALHELRRLAVPPFELNVPILVGGAVVAIADVLWRDLLAVLEIDSREFHFTERDWNATMHRHNRLSALGLTLTHFSPSRIRAGALREGVPGWLQHRARELGVPYRPAQAPRGQLALPLELS